MSLFAERRLIELRMSPKPGKEGGQALADYAANPAPDTVLLISCDKIDASGQRTKWFKALVAAGVVIQVWPIERKALPGWISQRMQGRGLQVSADAAALLADRVEGNLLAASQEIEKLLLLHGPGRIDVDAISASVADSARFNVFTLVDNALSGHVGRTVHMLNGLRSEGIAPVVVSWALGREIRTMTRMAQAISEGQAIESVMAQYRVWERRKPLLRMALKRTPLSRWYGLLRLSGQVEKSSKGAAAGNPWDELLQLGARLAGAQIALRQQRVS
jgi:DNA polymerase-3 subunit delta